MSNDDTSGYTQANIQRAKYSTKKIQVIKSSAMTWLADSSMKVWTSVDS